MAELRRCDEAAITTFLTEFGPFIRRTLRFRLKRAALSAAADSVDIYQSVVSSFFLRLAAGEYEINNESDLRRLVFGIAKKKFLMLHRRETAECRNHRNTTSLEAVQELASGQQDSAEVVEQLELLQKVRAELTDEEGLLFDRRRDGASWDEIAAELGETAVALRQRLSRALRKCSKLILGQEED
jgi:RNA polymerase sigma factor (sigma-70 family)